MGETTPIALTSAWQQVAPANQRVVLQRITGTVYLRYSVAEPDINNSAAFRSLDNVPLEIYNDVPLWAKAAATGKLIVVPVPTFTGSELPSGASTEGKQDNAIALLTQIAANQGTGDGALTSIDGKVSTEAKQDAMLVALGDIVAALGLTDTVDLGNLNGAATEAKQDAIEALLITINAALGGTLTVTLGLTDAELRATPVAVTRTDGATDTKQEQVRSLLDAINTKLGGTLTVNVGLTDAQLRATPVPISGALTDAQLRATAIPISNELGAKEAKQDAANALLVSLDGKTPLLIDGKQQVIAMDYGLAVSRGLIAGVTTKSITGYNPSASTSLEPIWSVSGTNYPFPTGAISAQIASSSAADTSAGTGARTVLVNYLTTSFVDTNAIVTLNGVTPVTIAADVYRVNMVAVLTTGSGNQNASSLWVGTGAFGTGAGFASNISKVEAGENVSQQAIYTVPAGKVFETLSFRPTLSAPARFRFQYRTAASNILLTAFNLPLDSSQAFTSPFASVFAAGTDLIVQSQSLGGTIYTGMIISGFLRSV